ncbi:MAG: N-acetylmuramoyl-L-alanine amidase, partial [Luteimonas sp.]|nr:N-acetylmuramoyl-L-alanine amidase [Luteimonas sp.]
ACALGSGVVVAGDDPGQAASEARALVADGATGDFARSLQAQEKRLSNERSYYPAMFRAAYARYPRIPAGTLEALAYSQSRWHQLRPDRNGEPPHGDMPRAWGVMGLYAGEGFADQVGEAAALLGTTSEQVKHSPATNILAAAVLLDRELRGSARDDEALAQALQDYAGFGDSAAATGAVDAYARASFAFDVLLGMDRGVNDNGIRVPERAVKWERAFPADMLVRLNAPLVRLDLDHDVVETEAFAVDPRSEQLVARSPAGEGAGIVGEPGNASLATVDFPGALWATSPNYNSRSGTAVREVAIHTMQGSYAGSISWFKNPNSQVSAHYLIRSSDGQVTQMVRESQRAWHVGSHNSHSIGIEHEGYISNPDWYTSAMYSKSAAITRQACGRYAGIVCTRAMKSYTSSKLSDTSYDILGHQNLTDNSHTDPGKYWNWSKYYGLINPTTGGTTILDSFESSVGHFVTSPTYSGSTTGISTASTAARNCSIRHNGSCSLQVRLVDNKSSSASWAVRLLSGSGNPGSNTGLSRSTGRIGFWVFAAGSGMRVAVGIDDSDGTERSASKALTANKWTYVEWKLSDAAQWSAWAGGSNGAITASTVKLDAIWLYHANTSYTVNTYIDNVQLIN